MITDTEVRRASLICLRFIILECGMVMNIKKARNKKGGVKYTIKLKGERE